MINYTICGSLLCILVTVLIFALFMSPAISKKMLAGHVGEDTKKIVQTPKDGLPQGHNFPGYVSLININIKDIQGCIQHIENRNKNSRDELTCLRFLYLLRLWLLRHALDIPIQQNDCESIPVGKKSAQKLQEVIDEFRTFHAETSSLVGGDINSVDISNYSINILKPGEVSGKNYKTDTWGRNGDGTTSGEALYTGRIGSLSKNLDDCPELYAHKELRPLRDFVKTNGLGGTVKCFYVYIGNCGALGLTEDMFHGLTRIGLIPVIGGTLKTVSMGSDLGNIETEPSIDLTNPWPRDAIGNNARGRDDCGSLSSIDMAETIVGVSDNRNSYDVVFNFVQNSIVNYINRGGDFTVPSIVNSETWTSLANVLNLNPLECRACSSLENIGCPACTG